MISLDSTLKSLEIKLAGAVATTELPFVASYVDINQSSFAISASSENDGTSNGSTAVTVAAAPGATTTRKLNYLSVVNVDTAAVTLTVQVNNNATKRISFKVTLQIGDQLSFTDAAGFVAFDTNGNVKQSFNGILPAANFPALSGDVTTTAGTLVTAIGALKVTNAMLAGSIAASKLVGSDIATVGTITAGVWNAGAVTSSGAGSFTGNLAFTSYAYSLTSAGMTSASATEIALHANTVNGGVLFGFGTTNDVTLANRAGTPVLGITANTTNATLAGVLTSAGEVKVTGGSASNGSMSKNATYGLTLTAVAGSLYDFTILDPTTNEILRVPTGTKNVVFPASGGHQFGPGSGTAAVYTGILNGSGALYVGADSSTAIAFGLGNYAAIVATPYSAGLSIAAYNASGAIRFYSGGTTERFRFETNGDLLPGADNTYSIGSTTKRLSELYINPASSGVGDTFICLKTDGQIRQGATCAASTKKIKSRIVNYGHGLAQLRKFKPVAYRYRHGFYGRRHDIGLLVEDLKKVDPRLVFYAPSTDRLKGNITIKKGDPMSPNIPAILAVAIRAIQDQDSLIQALNARVSSLRAQYAH